MFTAQTKAATVIGPVKSFEPAARRSLFRATASRKVESFYVRPCPLLRKGLGNRLLDFDIFSQRQMTFLLKKKFLNPLGTPAGIHVQQKLLPFPAHIRGCDLIFGRLYLKLFLSIFFTQDTFSGHPCVTQMQFRAR